MKMGAAPPNYFAAKLEAIQAKSRLNEARAASFNEQSSTELESAPDLWPVAAIAISLVSLGVSILALWAV